MPSCYLSGNCIRSGFAWMAVRLFAAEAVSSKASFEWQAIEVVFLALGRTVCRIAGLLDAKV